MKAVVFHNHVCAIDWDCDAVVFINTGQKDWSKLRRMAKEIADMIVADFKVIVIAPPTDKEFSKEFKEELARTLFGYETVEVM